MQTYLIYSMDIIYIIDDSWNIAEKIYVNSVPHIVTDKESFYLSMILLKKSIKTKLIESKLKNLPYTDYQSIKEIF